jgi:K+-transporting ATPase ATPase C chain
MMAHLRANVVLVLLTLILCSVLYPLALLVIGQTLFPEAASGSLVNGPDDRPVGSLLIAQYFKSDKYFQSRPSATSPMPYNAAASSGSNWAASSPRLRDRVARQLATMVRYTSGPNKGKRVAETTDIDAWFQAKPDRTRIWAERFPTLAEGWLKDNADPVKAWQEKNPSDETFFVAFARVHPGVWPGIDTRKVKDEKGQEQDVKSIKPVNTGEEVQQTFFDSWLQERGAADLELVPADLVTASGSGLDPHITLRGAHAQVDRVANAWARETGAPTAAIKGQLEEILKEKRILPLGGLVGEPLVNVLDLNLEVKKRLGKNGAR